MPPVKQEKKEEAKISIKNQASINKIIGIANKIKQDIEDGKPKGKVVRYPAGGGLYLEMSPTGGLHWRMKYRFHGKEKRLSFGPLSFLSFAEAQEEQRKAKSQLFNAIDPSAEKKAEKIKRLAPTFREIAEEYVKKQQEVWAASHTRTVQGRLNLDVYPAFGDTLITDIAAPEILAMLKKIEERRAFETASRVLGVCSLIFKYAISLGLVATDPCPALRRALTPYNKGQLAAITKPKEAGALMLAIDDYKGGLVVRSALLFSALTFCRPGEIRHAEWSEIDFENALWTIPAEKMKGRIEHKVPLAQQSLQVLEDIKPYTGNGKYIFPSPRTNNRPLSENGVLAALRSMGLPLISKAPIQADIYLLCLLPRDTVDKICKGTNTKNQTAIKNTCIYYKKYVDIYPCVFNFGVTLFLYTERNDLGVDSVEYQEFKNSIEYERAHNYPHHVTGGFNLPNGGDVNEFIENSLNSVDENFELLSALYSEKSGMFTIKGAT